jgi:hypothetical protein
MCGRERRMHENHLHPVLPPFVPAPSSGLPLLRMQSVYFPDESAEVLNDDANRFCFSGVKKTLEQVLAYGKTVGAPPLMERVADRG